MSELSAECDQKHKAYTDARSTAKDANAIVGSVAVDVAEQVLKNGTADTTILDLYEKAKELAGKKADLAKEAWEAYIQAYQTMTGQEKEVPPAGATAEGDETKTNR